jgi:2-succinyl-6-hydroxy-2,4-cyclohexadiene-1-carboxylate synthase
MGCGADWLSLAERLADQFYCLMPDLPGHGRHLALPMEQPLSFQSLASGLENFLDRLKLEKVSLIGYSMGGRLALYAATTFPKRIQALVLEGVNPGLADEPARRERASADDRQAEYLLAHGIDAFVEQWYELELFSSLKNQPTLLDTLKAQRRHNEAGWLAKVISELSPGRQPPLWPALERLTMPVLLIAGALDTKYTRLTTQIKAQLPEAVVAIIPEAGHNTHLEQPEQFIRQVRIFLESQFYD